MVSEVTRRKMLKSTGASVLGAGIPTAVSASAAAADGRTVYVGGRNGKLYAIDASTGRLQWEFKEPSNKVDSSPTVVNGTLYIGDSDDYYDVDDRLYAVDAETGEQKWTFGVEEQVVAIRSSPTVVNGTVYVSCSIGGQSDDTTNRLCALDAESGEPEWIFSGANPTSSPTVVDETVYVRSRTDTDSDDFLHAIDAATGDRKWTFSPENHRGTEIYAPSPTVFDGTVYFGTKRSQVFAVDVTTGQQEWVFETEHPVRSAPTVVDGVVYVGGGLLYAVDAATGDQKWSFDPPNGLHIRNSSATVSNGTAYVGTAATPPYYDGALHAVNTDTGDEEWSVTDGIGSIQVTPTVYDGTVFFGTGDGVYAVTAASGSRIWAFEEPEYGGRSSPTVVEDPSTGHSVGSRVELGTLGHHHVWAEKSASSTTDAADSQQGVSEGASTNESNEPNGGDGSPGPGIVGSISGLVAGGYLLARRRGETNR